MSLDKKSQMHNSDPLPLDLQFSLPAVMIMILLCLGYASFYDLVMQALELLILFCSHGNRILATSIVGKIWFYSSGIVDSEPFYNQFKETKLLRLNFRLKLANSYIAVFRIRRKEKIKLKCSRDTH